MYFAMFQGAVVYLIVYTIVFNCCLNVTFRMYLCYLAVVWLQKKYYSAKIPKDIDRSGVFPPEIAQMVVIMSHRMWADDQRTVSRCEGCFSATNQLPKCKSCSRFNNIDTGDLWKPMWMDSYIIYTSYWTKIDLFLSKEDSAFLLYHLPRGLATISYYATLIGFSPKYVYLSYVIPMTYIWMFNKI